MRNLLIVAALLSACIATAQQYQTENVFIISYDGLRWEEVFGGAVDSMMTDRTYVDNVKELQERFYARNAEERREKLLPFFWNTIVKEGVLYGNQWKGNKVTLTNPYWFSYPGYNELLTGFADENIDSNDKILNKNVTVLEWLNQQSELQGKVAAFASWDVFPYIINEERSGVPVNAGFEAATGDNLTAREQFLNELQSQIPSPWGTVRLDAFTHHYALEYIKKIQPRVVYIAYGETDDFAHDGEYDQYLKSAYQTDAFIAELWEYVQNNPQYKDKTTFLITTDHGRGDTDKAAWKSHGKAHPASEAVWIAAIGPDIKALGEVDSDQHFYQNQLAKTAALLLGYDYNLKEQIGEALEDMLKK